MNTNPLPNDFSVHTQTSGCCCECCCSCSACCDNCRCLPNTHTRRVPPQLLFDMCPSCKLPVLEWSCARVGSLQWKEATCCKDWQAQEKSCQHLCFASFEMCFVCSRHSSVSSSLLFAPLPLNSSIFLRAYSQPALFWWKWFLAHDCLVQFYCFIVQAFQKIKKGGNCVQLLYLFCELKPWSLHDWTVFVAHIQAAANYNPPTAEINYTASWFCCATRKWLDVISVLFLPWWSETLNYYECQY